MDKFVTDMNSFYQWNRLRDTKTGLVDMKEFKKSELSQSNSQKQSQPS